MDTRRLLLGDWTRWFRDGLDVLRLALVVGAIGFALAGDAGAALVLAGTALLGVIARLVNLPRMYDLAFMVAMSLQAWGEATGLYDRLAWFDTVVHVVLPCLVAPVLYIGLARLDVVPDPRDETHTEHYVGLFVLTLALGVAVGAVWEIVEWTSDGVFGTDLQEGNDDTMRDLLADVVGSLIGAGLLVLWTLEGWGSVRRIPGENRFEQTDA